MGNFSINDKYIQAKCLEYFENVFIPTLESIYSRLEKKESSELIEKLNEQDLVNKKRLGWYLLALECLCNITTPKEREILIESSVIDKNFNELIKINNDVSEDLGIDVVYIEHHQNLSASTVHLFNFKFRDNPAEQSGQSESEALASYNFLSTLINAPRNSTGKTRKCIGDIIDVLEKKKTKVIFYMVSNESNPLPNSHSVKTFKENFNVEVRSITQKEIIENILNKEKIECSLILNKSDLFDYNELKQVKVVITRLSALELIRISNKSPCLRNYESIIWSPEIEELSEIEFDYGVLNDNVRGYIKNSINNKVIDTLEYDANKFFLFNNGITIVSSNIETSSINLNKKIIVKLSDLQIVNGGQTLRNIYEYKDKLKNKNLRDDERQKIKSNLAKTFVLVRIFSSEDNDIKSNIAQYTNTQTSITKGQLYAFDIKQKMIETELSNKGIYYVIKDGDLGKENENLMVSMIQLAQILDSISGKPYRASGRKQDLIESHYEEIFTEDVVNNINSLSLYVQIYHQLYDLLEMNITSSEDRNSLLSKINYFKARRDSRAKFLDSIVMHILYTLKKIDSLSLDKIENTFKSSLQLLYEVILSLNLNTVAEVNARLATQDIKLEIDKKIEPPENSET